MAGSVVWVPVAASLRGFTGPIIQAASGAARRASNTMADEFERGGRRAGQQAASGLASQRKQIERVAQQIAAARDAEADAAGNVRVAEERLQELRQSGTASAARIARAEEQLAQARRAQETAQSRLASSTQQLERIRSGEAATSRTVIRAEEQLQAARNQVATANGQIRVAEARLNELRESGTASQAQLARAEEQLEAARRRQASAADQVRSRQLLLSAAQRDAARSTDQLNEANDEGRESSSGLRSSLGDLAIKAGALAGAAAGAAGGVAALAAAMVGAMDSEALNDKLAAQLGATPQMAKDFGTMAGHLYSQAYGDSLADVNDALRNVWQQGLIPEDATNAQIESVTARVLDLTAAFDQDLAGATAAVGTMMKSGLAPDAQAAMDIITRGFQQGADKGGDLLDTLTEYPALFEGLGLSGQQAMGLIAQGMQAGARSSDLVADALKEFQIRAQDGSKASAEAYGQLGLDAAKMTAQMARGGTDAASGLDIVLDRLRGMTDPVARNAAAVGLFGTQAEDLAGALFAIDPSNAVAALGQVDGAAARMGDTLNDNAATRLETFKRSLQTFAVGAGGALVGWLDNAAQVVLPKLGAAFGVVADVARGFADTAQSVAQFVGRNKDIFLAVAGTITALFLPALITSGITMAANAVTMGVMAAGMTAYNIAMKVVTIATRAWAAVQWVLNAALSANPIGIVIAIIVALVAAVVIAYKRSETFRNIVQAAWQGIKTAVGAVWGFLSGTVFPAFMAVLRTIGSVATWLWQNVMLPAWNGIKMAIGVAWAIIRPIISGFMTVVKVLGAIIGSIILGTIIVAWNLLKVVIMAVWNTVIKPVFTAIKAAAQLMWTGLQAVFGWIRAGFQLLGAGLAIVKDTIIVPVWNAIKAAAQFMWTGIQTIFGWFKAGWNLLAAGLRVIADTIIMPVWNAVKAGADFLWQGLKTIFDWIKSGWDLLGKGIRAVVDNVISPAWEAIKTGLGSVRDFFGTVVDAIGTVWDKLKGFVATPINFVINTVWNNGLLKAWNTIAGFLPGLKEMQPLAPIAMAEGGPVPMGRGAKRGKDSVHILGMPGEHMWDVADVQRAGGHGAVYRMRDMVMSGRPFTWTPNGVGTASEGGPLPRFEEGGAIEGGGRLAPLSGEGGLKPIAVLMRRLIFRIWKQIKDIGGYRQDAYPEHPSGRALDIMVPDLKTGDEVNGWVHANAPKFPIEHTLWKQRWRPQGNIDGSPMEDRGSPTQNHMDHVHSWWKDQAVNPNMVPDGLVGYDGMSDGDRLNIIKQKITEIVDKALNPIKEGMARVIGSPPPEWLGIPPKALDITKTKAIETAFDLASKLGDKLKDAYEAAKKVTTTVTNVVTAPARWVGGLFRDQGGYLPPGLSVVRNETGRPEAVLNWEQLEQVRKLLEATGKSALESTGKGIADFFGFGKLYDAIMPLVTGQQQGGDQGAAASGATDPDAGAAQSGATPDQGATTPGVDGQTAPTTTGSGGSYTDPSYGDGSTIEQKDVPLTTKMPDLNHTYDPKGGAEQWRPMAIEAMKRVGFDTAKAQVDAMIKQIQSESGGNPGIVQGVQDVNSGGNEAVGLLQIIPGTFAAHRDPSLPDDRRNPMANMVAALRYYKSRYGMDLTTTWGHGHGYDSGGWLQPGLTMAVNKTGRPEAILTAGQWAAIDSMLEALPSAAEFQSVADLAESRVKGMTPVEYPDMVPAGAGGRSAPLVHNENVWAVDVDELAVKQGREVRRATRSEQLVGGWG